MAGLPASVFLFRRPPRPGVFRGRHDGPWHCSSHLAPLNPPAPPAPPVPPAPPASSTSPSPLVLAAFMNGQPILTLLLPGSIPVANATEPTETDTGADTASETVKTGGTAGNEDVPHPERVWRDDDDWPEPAAGVKEDVEWWSCDGLSEHLPIPTNALDGSQDELCMQHQWNGELASVDDDDEVVVDGFFGNNVVEPESDGEDKEDGMEDGEEEDLDNSTSVRYH
ncbi:unnamed protein product [Closterium sp. NIES-54]